MKNIYFYLRTQKDTQDLIGIKTYLGATSDYKYQDMQATIFEELAKNFNLKNGYEYEPEPNAICFFYVVDVRDFPQHILARKDLLKIAYMGEPPNDWHGHSFDKQLLDKYFTEVITYWEPLIPNFHYSPFVYKFDPRNELHRALVRKDAHRKYDKSIGIILSNRPNDNFFTINDIELQRLEYLRQHYAEQLASHGLLVQARGNGWAGEHSRFTDTVETYDFLSNYNFALITENSSADGFVSEKIYDAFVAGCIPIYHGGNNTRLNIPKSMYIDLKDRKIGEVAEYIKNISNKEMDEIYQSIDRHLMEVLDKTSSYHLCHLIQTIIEADAASKRRPSVAVITASIGRPDLKDTVRSVQQQTYAATHYMFVNGQEFLDRANQENAEVTHPNLQVTYLNESTGRFTYGNTGEYGVPNGEYGPCGVYAAAPYLVSQDIMLYINDDDFWEPEHIETLIKFMYDNDLDWAHSMRNICSKDKQFICQDNCEALGAFSTCIGADDFLIECSGFAIKKSVMMKSANVWMYPHICDRLLAKHLITNYPNFGSPGKFTHWFRLGGNEKSASSEFFMQGNSKMAERFPNGYPWANGYIHRLQAA